MEKAKVIFVSENNQKIIIDCILNDDNSLEYHPSFDPIITDPKQNIGLGGKLCEVFINAIVNGENNK